MKRWTFSVFKYEGAWRIDIDGVIGGPGKSLDPRDDDHTWKTSMEAMDVLRKWAHDRGLRVSLREGGSKRIAGSLEPIGAQGQAS